MLAGGIAGWILWMFLPQQYDAVTHLSIGIDYNRTGKLENLQEDRIFGITEDILHSDAVMLPLFEQSGETDFMTFYQKTAISRTNETWRLSVRGTDPKEIGQLALLWLDTAYDALLTAKDHAIHAEALQNELEGLTSCIQNTAQSIIPSGCPENDEEIPYLIDVYTQNIQTELSASHGLSSAILIGSKNPEQLEIQPASRNAAADTFLGAFIGLIIAMAIPWFPAKEEQQ